jgi:hypothetical protein
VLSVNSSIAVRSALSARSHRPVRVLVARRQYNTVVAVSRLSLNRASRTQPGDSSHIKCPAPWINDKNARGETTTVASPAAPHGIGLDAPRHYPVRTMALG